MSRCRPDGFSLIEALLTLACLAALLSSAIWLLVGNARFYDRSIEVTDASRNLRAALGLVASEIRQASAADLLAAASDSVAIRFDTSRFIVCDSTGVDAVALIRFDTVRAPNLPASFRGTAVSAPYDSGYTYRDGWDAETADKGSGPRATCAALGAPTDLPAVSYRTVRGWRSGYGRLPPTGTLVRRYGRLSYRFGRSSFDDGLAIWRNGQELASPLGEGSRFTYLMAAGDERGTVPRDRLGEIRAVRIHLLATGRLGDRRFRPAVLLPAEHLVYLRN